MERINNILYLYFIIISSVLLTNYEYIALYLGKSDVFYPKVSLIALASLSLYSLIKENLYVKLFILLLLYYCSFMAIEFGSFYFVCFLFLLSFFEKDKDDRYYYWLVYILIATTYTNLILERVDSPYWLDGNAALILAKSYQFSGLISLDHIAFNTTLAKTLTYITLASEILISILVLTPLRKASFFIGFVFHFVLLFTTNILNWHLFLVIFYFILFRIHNKNFIINIKETD